MRSAAPLAAALVLLAGCSGGGTGGTGADSAAPTTESTTESTTGPGTEPTTEPTPGATTEPTSGATTGTLDWMPCDDIDGLECATLAVPLDHADPGGEQIDLAIVRQPAGDPGARIGSVVFNPGGPGGSGREFLELARLTVPTEVADVFDLVSFDPRGVGMSTPIDCELTIDDGIALVPDGDRTAWDRLLRTGLEELSTCTADPTALLSLAGTNNAARDLDLIREALGDERLTYVGFSYGTRLGATYAELFPDRVRALVLDGGVAPRIELDREQGAGFDQALDHFAAACDADPDCLLREVGPTLDVLAGLRTEIAEQGSFPTDDPDRVLTPGELDLGVASALYSKDAWVYLSQALYLAEVQGDGTLLQVLADRLVGREPDGTYSNQTESGAFVNCADDPARPDADAVWAEADAAADASRSFGPFLRADTGCLGFPDPVDPLVIGPAAGSAPILVIGTTGDPATPYEWSVELADSLDAGVLYTVEGEGHTAYTSIDCVAPVVNAYLIDLEVPAEGGSCADDSTDDVFPPVGETEAELVVAFFDCVREQGVDVPQVTVADVLADPSGEALLAQLDLGDPELLGAIAACQDVLSG
jgi:pimeloyl-ACP methyl ester carboxylesterase